MFPLVRPPAPGQRGFALLVVLWALILVSLLVFRLSEAGSGEARLGHNLRAAAIAEAAADGAFTDACVHLIESHGWSLAGGTHELAVPGGRASVTVVNEAGKIDLNNAAPALLASLFQLVGQPPAAAAAIAQNVAAWRTAPPQGQAAAILAPYQRAGRPYGPPGEPFQSVGEFALVAGVTPALFDRVRPDLTVYGLGDPVLAIAPQDVKQAAAATGAVETAAVPDLEGDDVVTLTVAVDAGGAFFTRTGTVQLEPGVAPEPFRVLTWGQGGG